MANRYGYREDRPGGIMLKSCLVTLGIFILLVSAAQGQECLTPAVWAPDDCQVKVLRIGRSLYFKVSCSERADLSIKLSSEGMPEKGTLPSVDRHLTKQNAISAQFHFEKLKPDTLYYYVLEVWDKEGCQSYRWGGHWTNQRNFSLLLKKILVYDDGDDSVSGKGELELYVWAREHSKSGPKELIRFGSQSESWADSGESYDVNKSLKVSNITYPGVDIDMKAVENDASGFAYDPGGPHEPPDTSSSEYFADLHQWEEDKQYIHDWSVTLLGSPSVKLVFKGWVTFIKGEDREDPSVEDQQPEKPVLAAQSSEGSDEAKEIKQWAYYKPPPPAIKEPVDNKAYLGAAVDFDIHAPEKPGYPTITALEIQFEYAQVDETSEKKLVNWIAETPIIGYDTIPGNTLDGGLPNANFEPKGRRRLRARCFPRYGLASDWSEWRYYTVNTLDEGPAKAVGLQPIVIKSPKGKRKYTTGSTMPIKWLATGVTGRMKITLLRKNGAVAGTIADNVIPPPPLPSGQSREMTHNWRVGEMKRGMLAPPRVFKIRVEEKGKYAAESDPFEITASGVQRSPSHAARKPAPQGKHVSVPSKPLRIMSPRNNQFFDFGADVPVKTDHDSRFQLTYELRRNNARKYEEVKPTGGALRGLGAGSYSIRISYQGEAAGMPVNFTVRDQERRTSPAPETRSQKQQRRQP